jgi:predicted helicase
MTVREFRPHQQEAADAVLRVLELPARSTLPERGLRTQVVMATGSGKTLVATRSAAELRAGRVLVLVPSLWIYSSRRGRRVARGRGHRPDDRGLVASARAAAR